jgi:hypothetical protein
MGDSANFLELEEVKRTQRLAEIIFFEEISPYFQFHNKYTNTTLEGNFSSGTGKIRCARFDKFTA